MPVKKAPPPPRRRWRCCRRFRIWCGVKAQLRRENAKFSSLLEEIPPEQWPDNGGVRPVKVYRSNRFLVMEYAERNCVCRLSVLRCDVTASGSWVDGITWDELQQIKADVGYEDFCAVEVYPRDVDVVNVANLRHLWILREPLSVGWFKRPATPPEPEDANG